MLRFLIAAPIVLLMVRLAVGAVRGQVRARSCCTVADPRHDLRMRSAVAGQRPSDR